MILMEELAELIQATSKLLRYGDMEPFLEEYADVAVMMEQARQLYHIDDKEINKRAGKKLFRALEGKCVTTKRD
jgi:NTP pyrophosphatase (non-canonical NTP hydrolase)